MARRFRAASAAAVALLAVVPLAVLQGTPATAVAHGDPVARPQSRAPWVVTVYQSAEVHAGADGEEMICSGTAVDARTVLTAAHCVEDLGADVLMVGSGAARMRKQALAAVTSVDVHPEYHSLDVTNDLAVLHTDSDLAVRSFPRLAAPAQVARAKRSSTRLRLYGWGLDERDRLTGRLERVTLKPRTKAARREWGSGFDPHVQLAAGALKAKARHYSGACEGDSGGPLVMTVRGRPVVVGVTSFGKGRCGVRSPTIFTSVGSYRGWIDAAVAGQAPTAPPDEAPSADPVEDELAVFDPLPHDPSTDW